MAKVVDIRPGPAAPTEATLLNVMAKTFRIAREDVLIKIAERYQKARSTIINDPEMQVLMQRDKRRAGEKMIHAATLLEMAGRQLIDLSEQERKANATKRDSKSS